MINMKIFEVRKSVLTAEAVKGSYILLYTVISEPMGVGSNPTQSEQQSLNFSINSNGFRLTFHLNLFRYACFFQDDNKLSMKIFVEIVDFSNFYSLLITKCLIK